MTAQGRGGPRGAATLSALGGAVRAGGSGSSVARTRQAVAACRTDSGPVYSFDTTSYRLARSSCTTSSKWSGWS